MKASLELAATQLRFTRVGGTPQVCVEVGRRRRQQNSLPAEHVSATAEVDDVRIRANGAQMQQAAAASN